MGPAKTTDRLNLREAPSLTARVITVIPDNTQVQITGAPKDGFYPVGYGHDNGWAFGDYLEPIEQTVLPPGKAFTTDRLNLRNEPSLEAKVITVIPSGAEVQITGAPKSGFYPVVYSTYTGWGFGDYLTRTDPDQYPVGPGYAVKPTRLLSGARRTASVLAILPRHADLTITGTPKGRFYPVTAAGKNGWANGGRIAPGSNPDDEPAGRNGFRWPARGPITLYFNPPIERGIDVGMPVGTAVRASKAGKVIFAGGSPCCSYGYYIILQHPDGYTTWYCHLSNIQVKVGQNVDDWEQIALSGNTGYSTGPHIEFQIRLNDVPMNPLNYLPAAGSNTGVPAG